MLQKSDPQDLISLIRYVENLADRTSATGTILRAWFLPVPTGGDLTGRYRFDFKPTTSCKVIKHAHLARWSMSELR